MIDKFSPELKVDPVELKNVFQSSNHTVPVRVMPTTVITIQLLVRNFNIVSLHMFVDYRYIKEIQLVFLDANGTAIKNAVRAHSYSNLWIDIVQCLVKVLWGKAFVEIRNRLPNLKKASYFWQW